MKTVTVKLPDEEAKRLNLLIKAKHYPSKSEFIRNLIREKVEDALKERHGWLALAELSLKKMWENENDDKVWSKYL